MKKLIAIALIFIMCLSLYSCKKKVEEPIDASLPLENQENILDAANAVYKAREKVSDFFGGSAAENVVFTLEDSYKI